MLRIETPDVVVVGLGPAGSRAATNAAKAGMRVVALERREAAGRPVQCAEFVPALLEQEFRDLSSVSRQTITRMITFVEEEAGDETANFPGHMIDRAAFDRLLAEEAAAAGANCRFGRAVLHIDTDGLLYTSDNLCIRPRIIIGADGPRSRVGATIGQRNRDLVETRQVTVPLLSPHDATDIFLSADYPGGYGWLFPKGSVANLGIGVRPQAKHQLKLLLDRLHWQLAAARGVGAKTMGLTGGAIPVGGRLQAAGSIGAVQVLLAGDAAGLANPVTGAGIAAAVQSGGLAGSAAAGWLGGRNAALDDYEEELGDIFDAALNRALHHRCALIARYENDARPNAAELRSGWIAYPQYWTSSFAGA